MLRALGVAPDMELVTLLLRLMAAAQDAPDRTAYLKQAMRRAIGETPGAVLQGEFED
jgi:hypothetical protein